MYPLPFGDAALGTPSKPLPVGGPSLLAWTVEKLKCFQFLANNLKEKNPPCVSPVAHLD